MDVDDLPRIPLIAQDDRAPAQIVGALKLEGAQRDIAVEDAGEALRIDAVIGRPRDGFGQGQGEVPHAGRHARGTMIGREIAGIGGRPIETGGIAGKGRLHPGQIAIFEGPQKGKEGGLRATLHERRAGEPGNQCRAKDAADSIAPVQHSVASGPIDETGIGCGIAGHPSTRRRGACRGGAMAVRYSGCPGGRIRIRWRGRAGRTRADASGHIGTMATGQSPAE